MVVTAASNLTQSSLPQSSLLSVPPERMIPNNPSSQSVIQPLHYDSPLFQENKLSHKNKLKQHLCVPSQIITNLKKCNPKGEDIVKRTQREGEHREKKRETVESMTFD